MKRNLTFNTVIYVLALSKASRSVAETLKSFKFFVVGSKQTDEERDIGLSFSCSTN